MSACSYRCQTAWKGGGEELGELKLRMRVWKLRMGPETPQGIPLYLIALEWGSAQDAPPMSWLDRRNTLLLLTVFHHCCTHFVYFIHTFSYRKPSLLKKRPHYPTSLPHLLPLNLQDLPSPGPKVEYLATGQTHPSVPGGSANPSPNSQ